MADNTGNVKRSSLKKFDAMKLVVDTSVNFREADGYDIPSMIEEIRLATKVVEPVHIREEDLVVLRGNRRVKAVQTMLADTNLSADIRKNIEQLECFFYKGLDEKGTTELVLDHGSQKGLTRVEVIKAVWRLTKLMYSEADIIVLLYQQLARFTGNVRKAHEAGNLPAGEAREKFLKTWLHGTTGNYIIPASRLGDLVREQFLLTETQKDRALSESEKSKQQFSVDRNRVKELLAARKEDEAEGGWSVDSGGTKFNELIAKYIKEDKPGSTGGGKKSDRPTTEQVENSASSMQSGMANAMRMAVGKLADGDKNKLIALDAEYHRRDKVFALLTAAAPKISDPNVKALVDAILTGEPEAVEKVVATFVVTA